MLARPIRLALLVALAAISFATTTRADDKVLKRITEIVV